MNNNRRGRKPLPPSKYKPLNDRKPMIQTFSNYLLINRGLSAETVKAYEQGLHDFARFINEQHTGVRWSTVTKAMVDEYVATMVTRELTPATIKQRISAIRTLYKTMMAMGADVQNPARYVSTPKVPDSLPKTIEQEAIEATLSDERTDLRAKALIAIIYETGLRLQEVLDLDAGCIDRERRAITVRGKGSKERVVYYGNLSARYGHFLRPQGLSQREARRLVFDALRPHSKAQQLSPHAIRHTFATTLLNNGMPMPTITKLMGHKHTETTEIYARLTNRSTQEQYLQFMPTLTQRGA